MMAIIDRVAQKLVSDINTDLSTLAKETVLAEGAIRGVNTFVVRIKEELSKEETPAPEEQPAWTGESEEAEAGEGDSDSVLTLDLNESK